MNQSTPDSAAPTASARDAAATSGRVAFAVTMLLVLGAHWRLAIGHGVIGGDPDRAYLPYKSELQRSLREGRLPHWSTRFGLGVPLLAESQVAALYPPNWLYAGWDVATTYHLLQLAHYLLLAAGVFAHARTLGVQPWGASLASISFTLCGFLAIHASHEVFTLALAWTPLALASTEQFAQSGRARWWFALVVVLTLQLLVGHFQMQFYTIALVALTGTLRSAHLLRGRELVRRVAALGLAPLFAALLAAPQLLPTWQVTRELHWANRSAADLTSYMYLPWHLPELLFSRLFQLPGGPEASYWHPFRTTGYETYFYVGVVPLMLAAAAIGLWRSEPAARVWLAIAAVTLLLSFGDATYEPVTPRTGRVERSAWARAYHGVMRVPGFGLFRAPARYTLITSYALAVLAALTLSRGCTRPDSTQTDATASRAIRSSALGTVLAVITVVTWSTFGSPELWRRAGLEPADRWFRLVQSLPVIVVGIAGIWCLPRARWMRVLLVVLTGIEMGVAFNQTPLFRGPLLRLPQESPVLAYLAAHPATGRVAGLAGNQNLPLRANAIVLEEYLGVTFSTLLKERHAVRLAMSSPFDVLSRIQSVCDLLAVEYLVWDGVLNVPGFELRWQGQDRVLDLVLRQQNPVVPAPPPGTWRVYRRSAPPTIVRVISNVEIVPSREEMAPALVFNRPDISSTVWLLPEERLPFSPAAGAAGRVESLQWRDDRLSARVNHRGPAYLLVSQQTFPGWQATVDGNEVNCYRAFGGLQLIPLAGSGRSQVELRFEPVAFRIGVYVSTATALLLAIWAARHACRAGRTRRTE